MKGKQQDDMALNENDELRRYNITGNTLRRNFGSTLKEEAIFFLYIILN